MLHQVCRNSPQFRRSTYNFWCLCYKNKKRYTQLSLGLPITTEFWFYTNIRITESLSHLLENCFLWCELHLHLDSFATSSNYWFPQFVQVYFFNTGLLFSPLSVWMMYTASRCLNIPKWHLVTEQQQFHQLNWVLLNLPLKFILQCVWLFHLLWRPPYFWLETHVNVFSTFGYPWIPTPLTVLLME